MKLPQSVILSLLVSASNPDCGSGHQRDIWNKLRLAISKYNREEHPDVNEEGHKAVEGYDIVINSLLARLFFDTLRSDKPEYLPLLFPIFVAFCAEGEEPAADEKMWENAVYKAAEVN